MKTDLILILLGAVFIFCLSLVESLISNLNKPYAINIYQYRLNMDICQFTMLANTNPNKDKEVKQIIDQFHINIRNELN